MVCGWWDAQEFPVLGGRIRMGMSEAAISTTKKFIFGPFDPSFPAVECPKFLSKETSND